MKRIAAAVLSLLIFSFLVVPTFAFQADIKDVCFSPQEGRTEKFVDQINVAKSEILVQAYSFTSAPIAKALVKAHK